MAKADEWFEINVLNWEKYNPRSDRGGFSWFRMDNQFYLHMRQRKGYSPTATVLMGFLLSEYSAGDAKPFKLRLGFAADLLGWTPGRVLEAIESLMAGGEIVFKRLEAACSQTDGRTDETDETDSTLKTVEKLNFDFESLYKKYPRKEGKSSGLKKAQREIKSQEDFDALSLAIDRYAKKCRADGTEPNYVKHFSTFMGCWRDYLDPNAGKVMLAPPPSPANQAAVFHDPSMQIEHTAPSDEIKKLLPWMKRDRGAS